MSITYPNATLDAGAAPTMAGGEQPD